MQLAISLVYLLAALPALVLAALCWWGPGRSAVSGPLALVMLASTWWIGGEFLTMVTGGHLQARVIALSTAGVPLVAVTFLAVARAMSEPHWRPRAPYFLTLLIPAGVVLAALTNDRHRLLIRQVAQTPQATTWSYGPVFWLAVGLTAGLFGYSCFILVRAMNDASRYHRRQLRSILLGALVPITAATVTGVQILLRGGDGTDLLDLTAPAFMFTVAIDAYALFGQGLVTMLPIARGLVFMDLADAVLVLDNDGRVVDVNPAAERLLIRRHPHHRGGFVGESGVNLLSDHPLTDATTWQDRLDLGGTWMDVDIRATPVRSRNATVGRVLVIRDVTQITAQRRELADVNDRLRQQVQTIESLRRHLAELAARDPLTGLHNRRHLELTLTTMVDTHTAEDGPFCVAVIDIDHFKSVNDEFGHGTGDDLLVEISRRLRSVVHPPETLARWGGEEFVVLLPHADKITGLQRAQDWVDLSREAVVTPYPDREAVVWRTVSVGLSCFPEDGGTASEIVTAADRALYEAKRTGRDRVMPAGPLARRTRQAPADRNRQPEQPGSPGVLR